MSKLTPYEFTRKSGWSGKTDTFVIAMTEEQYEELMSPNHRYMQDLLAHCMPEQREFLISGSTPEEWREMKGEF
jgi:hypothetical protein